MKTLLPALTLLAVCATTPRPVVPQPRQNAVDPTPAVQLLAEESPLPVDDALYKTWGQILGDLWLN